MKKTMKVVGVLLASILCGNVFAQITPPGGGGGGCTNCPPETNFYVRPYVPGLKLSAQSLDGTNLHLALKEADPAGKYDIYSASNLVSSVWNDVLQGTNGQINFSMPFPFADMGFFRAARTDTPVTDSGNMIASIPNGFVNSNLANAVISGGPAASMAILVNDTNFSGAHWIPFSAIPIVELGTNDGSYDVWFGLQGTNGIVYWSEASVTLDTTPLTLTLTNLVARSGSRPFIDPAGYTTKALSSLNFQVVDANGITNSGEGLVVDQTSNTTNMLYTTNWFACLDMALAKGTNNINIIAIDWAGNSVVTNFDYVFDTNSDVTPPTASLIWPQDGMKLSGSNFTVRGTLDDDTATVSGQWKDTYNVIQTVNGLVERGGQFWLENLPLYPGTNAITVKATDAAGNVTTTNLTFVQSGVTLTMDAVDDNQLNQVRVNVEGEISESASAVWVNGVRGVNYGDGTWAATNVPVTAGGTASFDMTSYPTGYTPTNHSWSNFAVEQAAYPNPFLSDPAQASVSQAKQAVVYVHQVIWSFYNYMEVNANFPDITSVSENWSQGVGGSLHRDTSFTNILGSSGTSVMDMNWPADAGLVPVLPADYHYVDHRSGHLFEDVTTNTTSYFGFPFYPIRFLDGYVDGHFEHISGSGMYTNVLGRYVQPTWSETTEFVVKLFTGGKALRQNKGLFRLSQALTWSTGDNFDGGQYDDSGTIPSQQISLGAQGTLGSDGNLYGVLADGQKVVITPRANRPFYFGNLPGQQKYKLAVTANDYPLADDRVRPKANYCVGQHMSFTPVWSPSLPDGTQKNPIQWAFGGTFVNTYTNADGVIDDDFPEVSKIYYKDANLLKNEVTAAWWISGGFSPSATYTATIGEGLTFPNGQYLAVSANGKFTMFRPQILSHEINSSGTVILDTNNLPIVKLGMNPFISWTTHAGLDTNFSCNLFYVQLVNWDAGYDGGALCLSFHDGIGDYLLDNTYPYGDMWPENPNDVGNYTSNGPINFGDGPDIALNACSFIDLNPSFKNYLCFQPTTANSIPVTLERGEWSEHGRADYANGLWSLTYGYVTGPSFYPDDSFPVWTQIFHNSSGN